MRFCSLSLRVLLFSAFIISSAWSSQTHANDTQRLRNWYFQAMNDEDRIVLQLRLILASNYNGIVDGDIGARSIRAIKAFQTNLRQPATGRLTRPQHSELKKRSGRISRKLDLRSIRDLRAGFSIFLPSALLGSRSKTRFGTRYTSLNEDLEIETIRLKGPRRTFQQLYDRLMSLPGRHVTYSTFQGSWFVITGIQNSKIFYTRFETDIYDQRGFSIAYQNYLQPKLSPVVIFMSNTFWPYKNDPISSSSPSDGSTERVNKSNPGSSYSRPSEEEKNTASSGSGFFITSDGVVVTNAHVVEECTSINIPGWGKARLLDIDKANDVALLKAPITSTKPKPLNLAKNRAKQGQDILVMGYPLRGLLSEHQDDLSVTTGVVSNLSGLQGDKKYLTISAPVQPGNSGGPLVNRSGEVLGIVSAKLNALKVMMMTGDVPQNVNFAIKNNVLKGRLLISDITHSEIEGTPTKYNDSSKLFEDLKDSVVLITCK